MCFLNCHLLAGVASAIGFAQRRKWDENSTCKLKGADFSRSVGPQADIVIPPGSTWLLFVVKFPLAEKPTAQQMQEISSVSFSGVFALRDGVSEEEFFPRLHAFFRHFIEMGFATGYRVMRREALDGFGQTLPAFTYRGELFYPDLEREHAAYEYVKQHGEQVNSLNVAMNSLVKSDADFFLETRIA